jgi:peptide/nickel transport system substrate-binding protein
VKIYKLFAFLIVLAMLVSGCAQATPTATPEVPAATEAPAKPDEPAKTEAPAMTEAPAAPEAPAAEKPDTLVLASVTDMRSLDPHVQEGMYPARSVTQWMFDVLVRSERDGSPTGELAKDWKQVDPLTWEFTLVEGAKFQNGEPVNAEAVKYSFDRMGDDDHVGFMQIFRQSKLKEVKVIDELSFQMITEEPAPELLFWLSESFIVPPKYYSESTAETLALEPIGSGPYKLVEWVKDDHLTFIANEDYWQGAPEIKNVVLRVIPEATTRMNELMAGNVHFITALNSEQYANIDTDKSDPLTVETWRKMHIGFGMESIEPFKNKLVRQALNYAVDKQAIIDGLMGGATSPLKSIVNAPQNNPALEPYPYDPDKAKALLAEAGYPDGFKMVLQTSVGVFGNDKDVSQAIAQYFGDVGVETEVEVMENGKYLDDVIRNNTVVDANYMGWGTYIVLGPQLATITCGHLDNSTKYCNPEYDALVKQAIPESDPVKREQLSFEAQQILWEDAPWVFLFRLPLFMGISSQVSWEPHPALYVDVMEFSFK